MIELILIVAGFVFAVRCRTLGRLTTEDFPGVDAAKFFQWQGAEVLANDMYLCATWGAAFVKITLSFILWHIGLTDDELLMAFFAGLVVWLGGLVVAVVYGSKARRLRTALFASRDEIRSRRSPQVASEALIAPLRRTTRRKRRQPSALRTSPISHSTSCWDEASCFGACGCGRCRWTVRCGLCGNAARCAQRRPAPR